MGKSEKNYWLIKTEPGKWSWEDQAKNKGISNWDGVKNHQAIKNLKSFRLNDLCFFYHSGTKSPQIVGVVTVIREWYEDDKGNGLVDVKAVGEMRRVVDLKKMKVELKIDKKDFGLFRQPRLSVVPVSEDVWDKILVLGNGYQGDGVCIDDDA
uniref:thymocyte nuclear protein 1 n=1 Tax=Erigeron canadensis TaxID=72917 RepID=UPI001CB93E07|nr:thymocyte nuclear protein 1 [Erigeron canadensis]